MPTGPITRPITGPKTRLVASPATGPEQATVPTLSPVELSGCDVDRINAALTATIAPATRTVYTCVWSIWERWCETRGLCAMPADPAAICAYLAERAEQGVAAGTLTQICSAIAYRHRVHGLADPTIDDAVRLVRRGLRRLIGAAPRRQAHPLSTTEIRQILDHIDRTTAKGARDAALILLGFASAMRRSELAALDLADISHRPGGILITIRHSKTDQDDAGHVVGVATASRPPPTLSPHSPPGAATGAADRARSSLACGPVSLTTRSQVRPSPGCSAPAPGGRPRGHPNHRPLPARWTRHRSRPSRRAARSDRRPDPPPTPCDPPRALHPPRPSPPDDLQQRARPLIEKHLPPAARSSSYRAPSPSPR